MFEMAYATMISTMRTGKAPRIETLLKSYRAAIVLVLPTSNQVCVMKQQITVTRSYLLHEVTRDFVKDIEPFHGPVLATIPAGACRMSRVPGLAAFISTHSFQACSWTLGDDCR